MAGMHQDGINHLAQFVPGDRFCEIVNALNMQACGAAAERVAENEEARLHGLYLAIAGSIGVIARRSKIAPSLLDLSAAQSVLLGQTIAGIPEHQREIALTEAITTLISLVGIKS
jgi:hypothetical protein